MLRDEFMEMRSMNLLQTSCAWRFLIWLSEGSQLSSFFETLSNVDIIMLPYTQLSNPDLVWGFKWCWLRQTGIGTDKINIPCAWIGEKMLDPQSLWIFELALAPCLEPGSPGHYELEPPVLRKYWTNKRYIPNIIGSNVCETLCHLRSPIPKRDSG